MDGEKDSGVLDLVWALAVLAGLTVYLTRHHGADETLNAVATEGRSGRA